MKIFAAIIVALLFAVPCIAMDQRDGSNGVPFLAPDPSLKTSDRFLANLGGQYIGEVSEAYQLPPIFGGPMPATESEDPAWMNLTAHNAKLNNEGPILIGSAYDMTEDQLGRAGIKIGKESWL